MKKFYFFIILAIFSSLVLISCSDNTYNLVKENISEIRYNILDYHDDIMSASFMSGMREKDYVANGINSALIDFAIIKLSFVENDFAYNEKKVNYCTVINGVEYKGEMLNNPYDNSFVIDLNINAQELSILDINLTIDGIDKSITLTKVNSQWEYDANKALQIVCKDLKEYINQLIIDNQLEAECFIKIVNNAEITDEYYWMIQINAINGTVFTEIVNPITGEILAKSIK